MLDIQFIRENPDQVKTAVKNKNLNPSVVDRLLEVDATRRDLIQKVQDLRAQRNLLTGKLKSTKDKDLIQQATVIKEQLKDIEPQLRTIESSFDQLMLQIPNIPLPEVPVGKDSSGNKTIKTWGDKPQFNFAPKDHIGLGTSLDLLDLDRGAKVAGFRGYFLKNEGVLLQLALMQYVLNKFILKGYTPMIPPVVDRRSAFINTGHFPWGESEAYRLAEDETDSDNDYFLAGTAEVPLVSFHAGEVLDEKDLPIRMVGYSPCFRREIGNYGADTKGFYRVHEFYKVEQVVIAKNDLVESRRLHEEMLLLRRDPSGIKASLSGAINVHRRYGGASSQKIRYRNLDAGQSRLW